MKKPLLPFVIVGFIAAFAGGWALTHYAFAAFRHNAPAPALTDKDLSKRAMEAFNKGDYAAALPLMKQWGETPAARNDIQQRTAIIFYITECQKQLGMIPLTAIDPSTGSERTPHTPIPAGKTAAMTIKELGNFDFDPIKNKPTDVPPDIKALDGSHLKLSGFLLPLNQADQITHFALVPTLGNCCFGQAPGVQHVITVTMDKDKSVDYTMDEIEVEGTLHVNPQSEDNYTYQIFELTGTNAKLKDQ